MFRPDAPAFTAPALLTDRPVVTLSTGTAPTKDNDGGTLQVGHTWLHEDTGSLLYYTGAAGNLWRAVTVEQADGLKLSLLCEIRDLLDTLVSDDE